MPTGSNPQDDKAEATPRGRKRFLNGVAGALGLTETNPLVVASRNLCSKLGLESWTSRPNENCIPGSGAALKKALIEIICERALTDEAYEHDRDNWQPMTFSQWQQMYLKSYCVFIFNDECLNLTLFMRHWEH
ncbi:MAG: hypothetical protein WCJ64_19555, partial [Rhodospirillaceae bacterium]